MAPEQAVGPPPLQPTTDVYGLTATLYHMLTRRPPFEGDHARVLVQLQTADPIPATKLLPELPRDLQAILERGMERDLRRRYQTVSQLEVDLRAFLAHRPVSVRPLSAAGRLWRRTRRAPAKSLAVAASVAALVLVAVLVPVWLTNTAHAKTAAKGRLWARIPALIAVEGHPRMRLVEALTKERRLSIELLDRILVLDAGDLPSREEQRGTPAPPSSETITGSPGEQPTRIVRLGARGREPHFGRSRRGCAG